MFQLKNETERDLVNQEIEKKIRFGVELLACWVVSKNINFVFKAKTEHQKVV